MQITSPLSGAGASSNLSAITQEIRSGLLSKLGHKGLQLEVEKFRPLVDLIEQIHPSSSWAEKAAKIIKANPELDHMQISMVHVVCLELEQPTNG